MDAETLLGERGSLRRNITVSLIVALIVAFIIALFRRFGDEIRSIPGMAPVMDFVAPGLTVPEYDVGEIERRDAPVFNIPPNVPPEINIDRGGASACCNTCGSSGRGSLLDDVTDFLDNATRNAAPPPNALPPAPEPCFPRTDWRAFANHPANRDLIRAYQNLTSEDWQWVTSYGFPANLSGYAQYMAEFDPAFSRGVRTGMRPDPYSFTTC